MNSLQELRISIDVWNEVRMSTMRKEWEDWVSETGVSVEYDAEVVEALSSTIIVLMMQFHPGSLLNWLAAFATKELTTIKQKLMMGRKKRKGVEWKLHLKQQRINFDWSTIAYEELDKLVDILADQLHHHKLRIQRM